MSCTNKSSVTKSKMSALEKVIMKKLQGSKKNIWMLEQAGR